MSCAIHPSRYLKNAHKSTTLNMLQTPYIKCNYETVYEPSEDSFVLLDALEKEQVYLANTFKDQLSVVCELGPGSGIVTTFMMQHGIPSKNYSIYIAADINPWALDATVNNADRNNCHKQYLEPIQSDLNSSLRPRQVDLLLFNPPYVPAEYVPEIPGSREDTSTWLDLALLGGEDGMVITGKVLNQLDNILSPTGIAYILFCARNNPEKVAEKMRKDEHWKVELVLHRKAGWEILSVYRFTRIQVHEKTSY